MSGLYSVRFLINLQNDAWTRYTVPPGHRAVLRTVTTANVESRAVVLHVTIAEAYVLFRPLPATERGYNFDTRVVAYSGETIGVYHEGHGMQSQAHGYLFVDGGARAIERPVAVDDAELEPPAGVLRLA